MLAGSSLLPGEDSAADRAADVALNMPFQIRFYRHNNYSSQAKKTGDGSGMMLQVLRPQYTGDSTKDPRYGVECSLDAPAGSITGCEVGYSGNADASEAIPDVRHSRRDITSLHDLLGGTVTINLQPVAWRPLASPYTLPYIIVNVANTQLVFRPSKMQAVVEADHSLSYVESIPSNLEGVVAKLR